MGVGRLSHLAQSEIEALGKQDIQQSNFVGARHAGSKMREGIRKTCGPINFEQHVGDAHIREAAVEIEDELIRLCRNIR